MIARLCVEIIHHILVFVLTRTTDIMMNSDYYMIFDIDYTVCFKNGNRLRLFRICISLCYALMNILALTLRTDDYVRHVFG